MSSGPLPSALHWLDTVVYVASRIASGFTIIAMFSTVVILVIARYVAQAPIFWGEELARYIMFYMILLGSAVALREDRHLRLRIVIDIMPAALQRQWERFLDLCLLVIAAVLFYQGLDITIEDGIMITPALRIAFFWVYLAYPIGAALMVIQLIGKQFSGVKKPPKTAHEE